jgi:hypothetical protein
MLGQKWNLPAVQSSMKQTLSLTTETGIPLGGASVDLQHFYLWTFTSVSLLEGIGCSSMKSTLQTNLQADLTLNNGKIYE